MELSSFLPYFVGYLFHFFIGRFEVPSFVTWNFNIWCRIFIFFSGLLSFAVENFRSLRIPPVGYRRLTFAASDFCVCLRVVSSYWNCLFPLFGYQPVPWIHGSSGLCRYRERGGDFTKNSWTCGFFVCHFVTYFMTYYHRCNQKLCWDLS